MAYVSLRRYWAVEIPNADPNAPTTYVFDLGQELREYRDYETTDIEMYAMARYYDDEKKGPYIQTVNPKDANGDDNYPLYYYFDDKGTVYLNGHPLLRPGSYAYPFLVAGTNTIAIAMTNTVSSTAALFTLKCFDSRDESTRQAIAYVHSDASGKGTVDTPASGWEQPGFDDSAWPGVKILGDAFTDPWYGHFDINYHTTPEERERFAAGDYDDPSLPPGLEQEPDPVARIVYRGHSPFVEINGRLHDPVFNICQTGDYYNESAIVRLARQGFDIVQLNFLAENFCRSDGSYDFSSVDKMVRRLLEIAPDAYVVVSPRFMMQFWIRTNMTERVGYAAGDPDPSAGDEFRERVLRPSPASDAFRALVVDMIKKLGQYVETRPWRKRLVGFRLSYGTYTEWCYFGMYEGPDNGPRMQERFRAYMKAKRNVDDAEIPPPSARKHEYSDSTQPNKNGDLLDPAEDQLVLDYYDCLINTMADFLLEMADAAKQAFPGRLVGAYYGYLYDDHPPEGATSLLDKVLSSPNVDILSCPAYYSKDGRRAGGSYVTRTIPSLFRRYGKLALLEDDSRFHHIRGWLASQNDGLALCTETALETEMCMRRNWFNQYFDGGGIQLNDPITQSGQRPHAFDDPAVFRAIEDSRAALAKAGLPPAGSGNEVAVVFSPREAIRRDGGKASYFTWNLYQTSLLYLNRSGIPFDLLSLEDYIADPRDYRVVLFLNAFHLSPDERAALVQRTRRPGLTAIWVGPAGGVTDNGFDDAAMSALTGVAATGVARRSNIVCVDPAATTHYTRHGVYHAKTLGGGARSIIVPDMPAGSDGTGPGEYATILKAAGARQYTAEGSYFRRHGDVFLFHTGTVGTHTITLPDDVAKVRELFTGEEFDSNVITLEADGPGHVALPGDDRKHLDGRRRRHRRPGHERRPLHRRHGPDGGLRRLLGRAVGSGGGLRRRRRRRRDARRQRAGRAPRRSDGERHPSGPAPQRPGRRRAGRDGARLPDRARRARNRGARDLGRNGAPRHRRLHQRRPPDRSRDLGAGRVPEVRPRRQRGRHAHPRARPRGRGPRLHDPALRTLARCPKSIGVVGWEALPPLACR